MTTIALPRPRNALLDRLRTIQIGVAARGAVGAGLATQRGGTAVPESSLLTGLVAYWKMDEASGNRYDSHTGGRDLIQTGTLGSATGKIGSAAGVFSAANFLRNSSAGLKIGTTDYTVAYWVKQTSFGVYTHLCSGAGGDGMPGFWILNIDATSSRVAFCLDGGKPRILQDFAHGMSTGGWYHWIVEFDRDANMRAYVNNSAKTPVAIASQSGSVVDNGPFSVGIYNASNALALDGYIDELGVWSRLLTGTEKTALYNGGTGITFPFTT